ncbi:MAG TPA: MopE-related protein [bacterium]|nr:MopE-related protein [bacterium]
MSSRSWAVVCLCLGFSLAGIGCGGSSLNGILVDGSADGTQKIGPSGTTTPSGGDDIHPSASTPAPTPTPAPAAEVCGDGIDNDANGVTDCSDIACSADAGCAPAPAAEVCNDGLDNDGNGVTDCTDLACASDAACSGGDPKGDPIDPGKYKAGTGEPEVGPAPECLSCPDEFGTTDDRFDPAPFEVVRGNRAEYHPSGQPFDKAAMLRQELMAGASEYTP